MKEYTDEQKEKIGGRIANIFGLRRRRSDRRYDTAWGSKTDRGIFEMFIRIGREIESGEL